MFYSVLAQLVAKYLSITAASVASERLFSTAKHIISDQQNSHDPNRAEMILFTRLDNVKIGNLKRKNRDHKKVPKQDEDTGNFLYLTARHS